MWTVCSKRSGDILTESDYMTRALFHAARGRGRTSPNPMVGAVLIIAAQRIVQEITGQGELADVVSLTPELVARASTAAVVDGAPQPG